MVKKYFREILIVVLAIVCFSSIRSCKVNGDDSVVLNHKADSAFLVAKYYENKSGKLVAQVSTHELTIKQVKKYADQLGFDNKELKKNVGRLSRLVAHWEGQTSMSDTIMVTLHDTTFLDKTKAEITAKTANWNNKFLDIELVLVNNDLSITYLYNVEFSLTAYHKAQKGFWKPPGQLVADLEFSDPNMKVSTFKGFVVKEDRKRWYETNGFKYGLGFLAGSYAVYKISR